MKKKYYFLALSLLPLALLLRVPGITSQTQMMSQTVLKPFLKAGHEVSHTLSDLTGYFVLFWRTFEEQQRNKQLIVALESRLEESEEIRKENERLRKLLAFQENLENEKIAARVIGWDLSPWKKTVILDKGSGHGLKKDMAVVVPEGLAGRVLDVGISTSRAILLTDPDARVSAVASDSRAQGIVSGDGSQRLLMRYLDLDSGVQVGETVLSSGLTGLFPKGIRIGKIESIEKDRDGLHLVAQVAPFVRMSKIEEVLCTASSRTK